MIMLPRLFTAFITKPVDDVPGVNKNSSFLSCSATSFSRGPVSFGRGMPPRSLHVRQGRLGLTKVARFLTVRARPRSSPQATGWQPLLESP
jgi:hypothetical protein